MRKHCLIFAVILAAIAVILIIFTLATRITSGTGSAEEPASEEKPVEDESGESGFGPNQTDGIQVSFEGHIAARGFRV